METQLRSRGDGGAAAAVILSWTEPTHFAMETRLRSKGDEGVAAVSSCRRLCRRRWRLSALRLRLAGGDGPPTTCGKSRQGASVTIGVGSGEPIMAGWLGEEGARLSSLVEHLRPSGVASEPEDR